MINPRPRKNENVQPTVVVVIDECDTTSDRFQDHSISIDFAVNSRMDQSGFETDVSESRREWPPRSRPSRKWLDPTRRHSILGPPGNRENCNRAHRCCLEKTTPAPADCSAGAGRCFLGATFRYQFSHSEDCTEKYTGRYVPWSIEDEPFTAPAGQAASASWIDSRFGATSPSASCLPVSLQMSLLTDRWSFMLWMDHSLERMSS